MNIAVREASLDSFLEQVLRTWNKTIQLWLMEASILDVLETLGRIYMGAPLLMDSKLKENRASTQHKFLGWQHLCPNLVALPKTKNMRPLER